MIAHQTLYQLYSKISTKSSEILTNIHRFILVQFTNAPSDSVHAIPAAIPSPKSKRPTFGSPVSARRRESIQSAPRTARSAPLRIRGTHGAKDDPGGTSAQRRQPSAPPSVRSPDREQIEDGQRGGDPPEPQPRLPEEPYRREGGKQSRRRPGKMDEGLPPVARPGKIEGQPHPEQASRPPPERDPEDPRRQQMPRLVDAYRRDRRREKRKDRGPFRPRPHRSLLSRARRIPVKIRAKNSPILS